VSSTTMSFRQMAVLHLQGLYTVAVGLALTTAIEKLVDQNALIPFRKLVIPYFAAYFVTLVPIYHGALCHLDQSYLGDSSTPKKGALLLDWILLFVESCTLYGLAILIQNPRSFSYVFLGLLLFDSVWALLANFAFSAQKGGLTFEARWAIVNFIAFVLLSVALIFLHSLDPDRKPVETYRWMLILILAVARTITDYIWCWKGYFPTDSVSVPATATVTVPVTVTVSASTPAP